jgi:hypothetical protein
MSVLLYVAVAILLLIGLGAVIGSPKDYTAQGWEKTLEHYGLTGFEAIWQTRAFPEPAHYKIEPWEGFGSVAHALLRDAAGQSLSIFVKRQKNYRIRDIFHPIRGGMTLHNELINLHRYRGLGILCPTPVYFAQRTNFIGCSRAVLIVEELAGFQPLDRFLASRWHPLQMSERKTLIHAIATEIKKLHARHL